MFLSESQRTQHPVSSTYVHRLTRPLGAPLAGTSAIHGVVLVMHVVLRYCHVPLRSTVLGRSVYKKKVSRAPQYNSVRGSFCLVILSGKAGLLRNLPYLPTPTCIYYINLYHYRKQGASPCAHTHTSPHSARPHCPFTPRPAAQRTRAHFFPDQWLFWHTGVYYFEFEAPSCLPANDGLSSASIRQWGLLCVSRDVEYSSFALVIGGIQS